MFQYRYLYGLLLNFKKPRIMENKFFDVILRLACCYSLLRPTFSLNTAIPLNWNFNLINDFGKTYSVVPF